MNPSIQSVSLFRTVLFLFLVSVWLPSSAASLPDFTELARENGPAVVNISTNQTITVQRMLPKGFEMPDLPEGSPFNEFFRRFFGEREGEGNGEGEERHSKSLGSGFVISKDGYILSNHHVIKDADEIIVRLNDRREFEAKIIGSDPRSDIALLKIEADDLPVVKIGTSADLEVGEWVLAIGSPFGFDHTITAGIVSAKGRSLPSENYVPFIQTDVAINPGNSGGPLFNLDGEVVGINAQIYSRTGGFMGLSFAIPIDMAMEVAAQLKESGRVARGWLGVMIQDVTRELAESFGMDRPSGALVAKILQDSPASKSGFQVGDIVLEFNGNPINRSSELPPVVGRTPVGKKVPVKILREGEVITLNMAVGELPDDESLELATGKHQRGHAHRRLGITVDDLTPEQKQELEVNGTGVLVIKVGKGPGRQAGLQEGDVLLMLNKVRVKDAKHFAKLVEALPIGEVVPVLVQRQGNPIFMALRAK